MLLFSRLIRGSDTVGTGGLLCVIALIDRSPGATTANMIYPILKGSKHTTGLR